MNRQNAQSLALIGAHGGAGVTTLVTFLDPDRKGHVIELKPGAELPFGFLPAVVARSTTAGMGKAADMLTAWHPRLPRPWLVVVRDAPLPLPSPVRYRRRVISSRVLGMVEVPYLAHLRLHDNAGDALTHRSVRRAAAHLRGRLLPH